MTTLNQVTIEREKGLLTPNQGGITAGFQCLVATDEAVDLVQSQAVKLVDVAGANIRVTAITAVTDSVFGFIPYGMTKNDYSADDSVKVFTDGAVMIMEASTAIAVGAEVEVIISGNKVVTNTAGTSIGIALGKAGASGDLIPVLITTKGL